MTKDETKSKWGRAQAINVADWLNELDQESDRGAAALALAVLEGLIEGAIRLVLVPDVSPTLGQLESQTRWARALGVISKEAARDLDRLRLIRNEMVHGFEVHEFASPGIARKCNELVAFRRCGKTKLGPREKFQETAVYLAQYLSERASRAKPPREPVGL